MATTYDTPAVKRVRHKPVKKRGLEGIVYSTNKSGTTYGYRIPGTNLYKYHDGLGAKEVKGILDGMKGNRATGATTGNPFMAVGDLIEKWRALKAVTVGASSMRLYEKKVKAHILPRWQNVAVRDVTPADITAWLATIKPGARGGVRAAFSGVMEVAVTSERAIPVNPVKLAVMPRVEQKVGEKKSKYIMSAEELDTLISRCPAWLRPMVEVQYAQALRLGEVVGLDWAQVDFEANTLNVDRQLYEDGSSVLPKHRLVREIELTEQARAVLLPMWMEDGQPSSGSVFGTSYRSYEEGFRRVRNGITFGGRVTTHTLRRTKITSLVEQGFTIDEVCFFARHRNTKETSEYYIGHRRDVERSERLRRAA